MSGSVFPPTGPTTLVNVLKAYVYQQYSDDENIQAFNAAYNIVAQQYMTYVVNLNLPIYTGLSGALLDWIARGLYGITRPSLAYGSVSYMGPLNTYGLNPPGIGLNTTVQIGFIQAYSVSDDIFKRIITWNFFKGDGFYFCVTWLKRRIMRFLTCANGLAPNIDNTYLVSVTFGPNYSVKITVTVGTIVTLFVAQIFQAAVASGVLQLPFQYAFTVIIADAASGLVNNAGFVCLAAGTTGYPTSATGLPAGALWSNGSFIAIVPGSTPSGVPVYLANYTAATLLVFGGANLRTTAPATGSGELWNNGGFVCAA